MNKHTHEYQFAKIIHQNIDIFPRFDFKIKREDYVLLFCKSCGELLTKKIGELK